MTKFHQISQFARSKSFDKGLSRDYRVEESNQVPLTQFGLFNLRLRALRRGVWFKVLSKVERGLIDLVLRTVRRVRSSVLARSLIIVVKKLLSTMESKITRQTRTIGFSLAQRLSRIAESWGNKSSIMWTRDYDYAEFLAICHINTPAIFKG